MVWSPRQIAELADTSRRAVRHYTDVGLLAEPEHDTNGYGRYGVHHLVRLLRIRRLTQLGLTLPQIAALDETDEHPAGALRRLDAELAARIEELQATRTELAVMLQRAAPTDLPLDIAAHVRDLPDVERAFVVVLSRVLDPAALEAYVHLLVPYRDDPSVIAFDHLGDGVEQQTRADVAVDLAAHLRTLSAAQWPRFELLEAGAKPGRRTIDAAIRNLYGPAQLDVMAQVQRLSPYAGAARSMN
ncbi:MerR family transcriptional regulator [Phycicoccus sp. BSK3Z-2]|uniref:MerR family transcriptional regulator n=1 Tax=Phycicoccus avicenniae TaxID=2828860 RepID=A0A941D538_9MICO|nr:MerR family transcriptional regulator [Phycicoccus avicenniae]MBR7741841.1 MerR family transcriptional regulator [Phycicoccus avicenniae]